MHVSKRTHPSAAVERVAACVLVAAAVVVVVFTAVTPCPTAGLLGLPCPGCGLSRAVLALLSGRFDEALGYQPLVPFVLACLLGLAAVHGLGQQSQWPRGAALARRAAGWANGLSLLCLCGLIVVWVLRFAGYFGGPVAVNSWAAVLHSWAAVLR